MMYFLVNFKYQFSHRCFILWKFKTWLQFFKCSIARFTIRFYVILKSIWFRFVRFCNFYIDAWFHHVEKICSKISNNASLKKSYRWKNYIVEKIISLKKSIEFQNSLLKKFARKFQTEFVKIQSKKHKRLL